MINPWIIIGIVVFILLITFLVIFVLLSWNIPVTILRFTGDKHRPMVIHKKAKKRIIRGVPHLQVRGYKGTIRDFKSDYYWPAAKGKYGALVLWEFEDGWLTPTIPRKGAVTPENKKRYRESYDTLKELCKVTFDYDPETHHALKLKVVDDVDMEFLVEQLARQDQQYTGGFWAFMEKYGSQVTVMVIVICLLTGFIIYLKQAPDLSAQCLSQLGEVVREDFLQKMSQAAVPPG